MQHGTSVQVVLLAILLALAGCTTGAVVDDTTPTATPTTTATATETPTATTTVDNPWGKQTLTVAINNTANERDIEPLVAETLDFWEENIDEYTAYSTEFELEPNAENPDIIVVFKETVVCDFTVDPNNETLGCASILTEGTTAQPPEEVEISTGYTDESTTTTMKHEFGHLLGLEHGDDPDRIMAASGKSVQLPQPDATERALPWQSETLTVAVDVSNESGSHPQSVYNSQVDHALEFYASGADGAVPNNVSFSRVESADKADITIVLADGKACGEYEGSCGQRSGYDADDDGKLEYYNGFEIQLAGGLDRDAAGWHVGYWLGFAFGATGPGDVPEVFQDADYSERRSNWWR